eukprot:TRINITY_DN1495_c1_g2_i9.p1 TRINITY_DN1495_c1_g2~~TRINITY_DN1495_c1_g2_i9.p1  ORF type:complete len:283 (+),score=8.64 TRINITY_DN1495_c1_g2_i9:44-892(+)
MVVSQLSLNYVMMDTRFNLFYKLLLFVSFVLTLSLLFYHNSYSPPRYITPATVLTFHQQYREKYLLTLDTNNSTNVPKIAYFIQVAQEQMENANYLVDRILDPFNYYALHINKGMANEELEWGLWLLQQQNQTYSNIFLLERYYSTYEGVTAVDVEVMGMAFMLEKFRDWDYFINLEAGDYPLLPQYSIRDVLREGNVSFMTSWPAECFHVDHRQEVLRYDGALGGTLCQDQKEAIARLRFYTIQRILAAHFDQIIGQIYSLLHGWICKTPIAIFFKYVSSF